ncbi:MAG: hypothetical protein H6728_18000 [Myxococcales bacterium]|nr:hypothetical protein [Myxococcales bacterium]
MEELRAYMERFGIQGRLIQDIGDTPSVATAAEALGVTPERVLKTLLFLVDMPDSPTPQPIIVISHGLQRVDQKRLSTYLEVGRRRIKFAPADVVLKTLGYPAGGVPPFGHRTTCRILLDASVMSLHTNEESLVYAGGGDDKTMLEIALSRLLAITSPEIVPLSETEKEPDASPSSSL